MTFLRHSLHADFHNRLIRLKTHTTGQVMAIQQLAAVHRDDGFFFLCQLSWKTFVHPTRQARSNHTHSQPVRQAVVSKKICLSLGLQNTS